MREQAGIGRGKIDREVYRVIIPFERLSTEALRSVIEEFVTRDGTDYGLVEMNIEQKIGVISSQLKKGDALVVYDEKTETTNIVSKEDLLKIKK